jgi:F-type H+-transporting ATPase subunit delta
MRLSPAQYAQALFEAIEQTNPKDHEIILEKFVKILAQNGDIAKYPAIETELRSLELKKSGISEAVTTLAKDIEFNSQIVDDLNKVSRQKVEIRKKIDSDIVGGVIVKIDDTLIDASVKGQLNELSKHLSS